MSRLVLVGASGLALEALVVADALGREVVVLDDDPATHGRTWGSARVVGPLAAVADLPPDPVIVAIGPSGVRARVVERLAGMGVGPDRWGSLWHPDVRVPAGCTVGPGAIALAGVVLTADVHVGSHVVLMPGVTLTHGCRVGDAATLCAGVRLGGEVRVGERAYVGMGACVRERVRIGADATLGMGAVLLKDLPPGDTWVGNPARPLRRGPRLAQEVS